MSSANNVLCIGGLAAQPASWQLLTAQLGDAYHPLLPNPYVCKATVLNSFTAICEHLIQQLHATPVHHIITHSMGIIVALKLLPHMPHVRTLCALGPIGLSTQTAILDPHLAEVDGSEQIDFMRVLFTLTRRSFSPDFLRSHSRLLRSWSSSMSQAQLFAMMGGQLEALQRMGHNCIPESMPPCLMVAAERDAVVPLSISLATAEALKASTVILPNITAHGFPIEEAATVAMHCRAFMDAHTLRHGINGAASSEPDRDVGYT